MESPIVIMVSALVFLFGVGLLLDIWRPWKKRLLCEIFWHDDEQIVDHERRIMYSLCWQCGFIWQDTAQQMANKGHSIFKDKDHTCPRCRRWKSQFKNLCEACVEKA